MRVQSLHIDGFGIFHDRELGGFKKGINLVVGANEAGKSTLLQFFRYTLFGYPSKVKERMHPLRGGNHGGRIVAKMKDGKKVTFERMGGASGGNIRLILPNRESTSQEEWTGLLDQESRTMYENIYAFSLDELVNFDNLTESGIRDRLFSVQLGLGEVSLKEVAGQLQLASDEIYKSRGSTQLVPNLKNELEDKTGKLQALQAKKDEYERLKTELAEADEEIEKQEKELSKRNQKVTKRGQLLQCYGNYYELMDIRQKLEGAPEPLGLDSALMDQMDEHVRTLKAAKDDLEKLDDKKKREQQKLDAVELDEQILEKEGAIKWLENHLEKYKSDVASLKRLRGEIAEGHERIRQELQEIGEGRKKEEVRAFEGFAQKVDLVEQFQQRYDSLRNRRMRLEAAQGSVQPGTAIDTRKVFIGLGVIVLAVGIGLLISGMTSFGIILLVAALGLMGYAFFGLKPLATKLSGKNEWELLKEEQNATDREYAELMKSLHLSTQLQPSTARDILKKTKELQERILALDKRKEQLEELEISKREFENRLQSVNGTSDNAELAVDKLATALEREQNNQTEVHGLEKRIQEYADEIAEQQINARQVQSSIDQLLEQLDVKDTGAFYQKVKTDLQVQEWKEAEAFQVKQLERIAGRGKAGEVVEYLEKNEKGTLESRLAELEAEYEQLEKSVNEMRDRRGQLRKSLADLEEVESLSEVLTEINALRNQLRDAYKEWLANQVALQMLEKEKKRFEKEKQPEVIRLSQQYFSKITKGRYPRIQMPLSGEEVTIYDAQERSKRIPELSRGTREQLLISLRLGFIEAYEKNSEPLPIVMDEILVNFDPARTRETTEILADFAQDRQLLFFTCHPNTEQFFEGLDYNLIQLDGDEQQGESLFG